MSVLLLCAVWDNKVGAFMQPFVSRSKGEAIRSFSDAVGDKQSPFCKHPEDYHLASLGEFDDNSGMIKPEVKSIITASECLNFRDPAGDVSGVS